MSTDKRVIAVGVAIIYFIAGIIMIDRADYPWATVQFCLAYFSFLTAVI